MKAEDEKLLMQLSIKLVAALASVLDEESDSYIDLEELERNEKGALFTHAILNTAPAIFVGKVLNLGDRDLLEMNHIANKLIFQFLKDKDGEE